MYISVCIYCCLNLYVYINVGSHITQAQAQDCLPTEAKQGWAPASSFILGVKPRSWLSVVIKSPRMSFEKD